MIFKESLAYNTMATGKKTFGKTLIFEFYFYSLDLNSFMYYMSIYHIFNFIIYFIFIHYFNDKFDLDSQTMILDVKAVLEEN